MSNPLVREGVLWGFRGQTAAESLKAAVPYCEKKYSRPKLIGISPNETLDTDEIDGIEVIRDARVLIGTAMLALKVE